MANKCTKCGKGPQVGHSVSHSNIKTLRRFNPNIIKKRVFNVALGKMSKIKVCSACLRTMVKVQKIRVGKGTARKAAVAA